MELQTVNIGVVLMASVVAMAIGSLWYSPLLFGKQWTKLVGFSEKQLKEMYAKGAAKSFAWGFFSNLVMIYFLAQLFAWTGVSSLGEGVRLVLAVWVGFILTLTAGSVLWEGKPFKLYLLNGLYWFVVLLANGFILATWS